MSFHDKAALQSELPLKEINQHAWFFFFFGMLLEANSFSVCSLKKKKKGKNSH